jgi:parallel beta-helix repeat protein
MEMRTDMRNHSFRVHAFTLAFLAIPLVSPAVWAATYYVDRNHSGASDSNPGTENQPWRTIQRAANVAAAGDTVLVKGGIYNEAVFITRSGTAGARITFKAYPGSRPIVDGTGKVPDWKALFYSGTYSGGTRYVTVDGFELRNSTYYGIRVILSDYWEIKNCRIHDTGKGGIATHQSSHLLIRNNDVSNTGWNGINLQGGNNNIVEYNRSFNNYYHAGVNIMPDHPAGDYNFMNYNIIRYNYIYNNKTGIYIRNQRYMQIYENVIYDNDRNSGWAGIFLHEGDGSSASFVSNSSIYNNTIVGHPVGIENTSHRYLTIKNNIFYYQSRAPLRLHETNQIVDYNLCYGLDDSQKGPNGIYADPQFVDPAAKDFRVRSTSPVLGAGEGGKNIGAVPPPGTDPVDPVVPQPDPPPATTVPAPPGNFRMKKL